MSGPAALARADAVIRMSQAPPKPVKRSLKVIPAPAPGTDALVSAPPVLETSGHAMEYVCGSCATPLIHANENQIHGLIIPLHQVRPRGRVLGHHANPNFGYRICR